MGAEYAYRSQLIDFYSPELKAFNNSEDLTTSYQQDTILCMGDSFTAGKYSYPSFLRELEKKYRIINSGIPGTGVLQANYIASKRFKEFDPDIFIYQVYVGNDLFDIRYPENKGSIPLSRSLYWQVAEELRVVGYINYRLGQMLVGTDDSSQLNFDPITEGLRSLTEIAKPKGPSEIFSIEKYSPRDRLYIKAEPDLIENHVMLGSERTPEFREFLNGLTQLLSHCKAPKCKPIVVFIPHASQTHSRYLESLRELGGSFSDSFKTSGNEYPFFVETGKYLRGNGFNHVKLLNPLPAFRTHESNKVPLYYENDPHLNPTGQALLAHLILDPMN